MLAALLEAIASDLSLYTLITQMAFVLFVGVALWGVFSRRADVWLSKKVGTALFLTLALCALLAARWPVLFVRDMLNVDEAQALAQAITALHDPLPWLSFDGDTSGPLNSYILMLPALLGHQPTFLTTRLICVFLEFGSAAALYGCAITLIEPAIARIVIIPPIACFAGLIDRELVHYSSERLSIFLGMLALWVLSLAAERRFRKTLIFLCGCIIGAIPFAKIQAVPLDVATTLVLGIVLWSSRLSNREKRNRSLLFFAGCLVTPIAILLPVALHGALNDFWISYVLHSAAYVYGDYQPLGWLIGMHEFAPQFDFLCIVAALGLVSFLASRRNIKRKEHFVFFLSLIIFLGGMLSVFSPRHATFHYVLFGLLPAAAAATAALNLFFFLARSDRAKARVKAFVVVAFVGTSIAVQGAFIHVDYPYLGAVSDYFTGQPDPVTQLLDQYVRPGDRIAIWGWRPNYYVLTNTLLGTRNSTSAYELSEAYNPYISYYRGRYLRDLRDRQPLVFLDTSVDSFNWETPAEARREIFPELLSYVQQAYYPIAVTGSTVLYLRRSGGVSRK